MRYNLEALGDERFQQFAQALLVKQFPTLQCLPVGQPDGGRDAFSRTWNRAGTGGFVAFQVKYTRDPSTREARDVIASVVETEASKVASLISQGATSYYLITNVSGTSHPKTGSIDKVNKQLTDALGIETHCWWRDDIESRVDGQPAIKWSYPEIIRATDLLEYFFTTQGDSAAQGRTDALRAFMAYQYRYDQKLKFKQVDLERSIQDLFVDVPARIVATHDTGAHLEWVQIINEALKDERPSGYHQRYEEGSDTAKLPGALRLLLYTPFIEKCRRIVIEGAPGQGKSTITQYLCQIHRMSLLSKPELIKIKGEHKPNDSRIPFRLDMRDYGRWLGGLDPFSDDPSARRAQASSHVLESFIAAHVSSNTGHAFSASDLTSISKHAQLLIVLDGFDEVADIGLRNRIVTEVSNAASRLEESALSLQIVVTSRPAAFANSPGFPHDEWQHVQITALSNPAILEYAQKWLDGRENEPREKREVIRVLTEKLSQAHVRNLAYNPMQLSILLTLISVQGASLPDKRTSLYDKYIDIFLDREAEKSVIVRDHRGLLVHIHRYLAWTLHVEAESERGTGLISEQRLRETINSFLRQQGYQTNKVDALFTGIVERVVALVSRVQGTFEFEVQPLREYFAARYLHDTAPYSPSGDQKRGALPDRLEGLAKNFYWLNVTRFFAGCYSSGELASLIDGLESIEGLDDFKYISHIPEMRITFLADHVFSQQPKLITRLIQNNLTEPTFSLLLSKRFFGSTDTPFTLPPGEARDRLLAVCRSYVETRRPDERRYAACSLMSANMTTDEMHGYWLESLDSIEDRGLWADIGSYLGLIEKMDVREGLDIYQRAGKGLLTRFLWSERFDIIEEGNLWEPLLEELLADGRTGYFSIHGSQPHVSLLGHLYMNVSSLLTSVPRMDTKEAKQDVPLWSTIHRRSYRYAAPDSEERLKDVDLNTLGGPAMASLWLRSEALLQATLESLRRDPKLWSSFIEQCRIVWGDKWAFMKMATTIANQYKYDFLESGLSDRPLLIFACHARKNASNFDWWRHELSLATEKNLLWRRFLFLCLLVFLPKRSLYVLPKDFTVAIEEMSEEEWTVLAKTLNAMGLQSRGRQPKDLKQSEESLKERLSDRLTHVLILKSSPKSAWLTIVNKYPNPGKLSESVLDMISDVLSYLALKQGFDWKVALPYIESAHEKNISIHFGFRIERGSGSMSLPTDVAMDICSRGHKFPLELLDMAESTLAASVGAKVLSVGDVAATNGWFAE
ncbi:hypothetical protein [Mesorhizobium sp.]|uniref:NACHT domain-containing protein n=1 Tax=Mesorhizobium sp. TaxID=1871066 RepID=UPI000FEA29EC|nr:hypothetical protein [Mesorhizobium sp.]RWK59262.1 MAG: hypothetical protein EOR49_27380 [Mesorhizobium sp.]RWM43053.1 MAG: hypothetical protein EOR76_31320 [Mesorhizobium sp.]RWM47016.1 MAG: hypothetical protein EOR78_31360 [Mesorhizobium sp.]RWM49923.1 MAG: hypothetical protein EOR79_30715 [Mesorhizobium sp.]RWM91973.1 MAG: hypothetical protein EOR85_28770 [Mesorhizobium sp.]